VEITSMIWGSLTIFPPVPVSGTVRAVVSLEDQPADNGIMSIVGFHLEFTLAQA
jgi:hypothetical protein